MAGFAKIPEAILNYVLTVQPQKNNVTDTNELPNGHIHCAEQIRELCNLVFKKYVKWDKDERDAKEQKTKGQNYQFWQDQRKI